VTGRPVLVAAHLLAEFSTRAEDLLVAARKVRAREGDDAVHDLRVATRRLADILSLWRAALERRPARRARRALDRMRRALGEVREHEVHADMLAKLLADAPPELASAGRALQSKLEARLEKEHARAAVAADAVLVARILARVERATAGVAARLAADPALIDRATERAHRREERARRARRARNGARRVRHSARIEAKKARTLECMNAIGVRGTRGERVPAAQRELGTAHDRATLSAWIEKERARARAPRRRGRQRLCPDARRRVDRRARRPRGRARSARRDGFRPPEELAGLGSLAARCRRLQHDPHRALRAAATGARPGRAPPTPRAARFPSPGPRSVIAPPARDTVTRTSWYWLRSSASAMRRMAASQRTVLRAFRESSSPRLFFGRPLPCQRATCATISTSSSGSPRSPPCLIR
jgi:CHAD domain-containing protein